jgi:hypothetical protein
MAGSWTREGGAKAVGTQRVMSDVTPDNDWKPGAQYASKRGGRGPVPEAEPGQAVRLAAANARAWDAIRRVREADPNWEPQRASAYGAGIESDIRKANDLAEEAEARVRELTRYQTEPIVPRQRPATSRERNDIAREIAKWLAKKLGRDVESVPWLEEYERAIDAYLDPPKTLEELQEGASTPTRGYQIHHIVEQKSAEDDKFPRSMIDRPRIWCESRHSGTGRSTDGMEDRIKSLVKCHQENISKEKIGMNGSESAWTPLYSIRSSSHEAGQSSRPD